MGEWERDSNPLCWGNVLVSELLNQPEIDYDEQADLLFKLTGQAVDHFESYLAEKEIQNVVVYPHHLKVQWDAQSISRDALAQ